MSAVPREVDVLVVGCGPVGAAIGALLGRYGVPTLVIDKTIDVVMAPRAIALDHEALRILQRVGLDDGAFVKQVIPFVRMLSPQAGEFARMDTAGSVDCHAKLVTFYQPDLERALRAKLAQLASVSSCYGAELISFEQTPELVLAQVRDRAGALGTVAARYVVAADGASSAVRQQLGRGFPGKTYPSDWLVVDVRNPPRPIDHVEFLCDARRPTPHMVAPGGRERWEFMLHPGEDRAEMERTEKVLALLAPWGITNAADIERKAVYRFHARVCDAFSQGRVFLAGDAAHVTPPFAGQGLVAGLRDAVNLAWKLAWVVQGRAAPEILASYDGERRPHAKQVVALAQSLGRLITPRNRLSASLLHGAVRRARAIPAVRQQIDQLGLKPLPVFRRGLFATTGEGGPFARGGWLPQGWLHAHGGSALRSDAAARSDLCCIGFGVDPERRLDADTRARFVACGGSFVQFGARSGETPLGPRSYAVAADGPFAAAVREGHVAIARPDFTVLHAGPAQHSTRVLREALALLAAAHPPAPTRGAFR
ncbi:MAG: hypothetical protein RL385_131 [Pseudomonadota bacterium]